MARTQIKAHIGGAGSGLTFNSGEYLRKFQSLGFMSEKTDSEFVRNIAGQLVTKLARQTPLAPRKYKEAGRARAGWWPATIALGRKTVFTKHPNYGEGSIIDGSQKKKQPSIMIENGVPYITKMVHRLGWFRSGMASIERKLQFQLEYAYRNAFKKAGF